MGLRLRIMSGRGRCKCTIGSATIRAIFQGGMAMKRCGLLSSMLPDSCAFIKAYAQRPGMVGVPAGLEQLRAFSKEYLPFAEKIASEPLQRQRRE